MRRWALSLLLLAGCTTVSTNALDDRTMVFSGRGSAFNNIGDVESKILVQAATEAERRGYAYFAIMGSRDASSTGYYRTPSTTSGSAYGTANCVGGSCYGSAYGSSTTYPGQTFAFNKPGADVVVRFFHASEVDPNAQGVWSTASVLAAHPQKR